MENVYHSQEKNLPDTKQQNIKKKDICMQNKLHAEQFSLFPASPTIQTPTGNRFYAIVEGEASSIPIKTQ
jgi:hypothetical protein